MIYKIAARYIRQSRLLCTILTLLLTVAIGIGVMVTSSIYIKIKKYAELAPYINQNGVLLAAPYYQSPENILLRDSDELRSYFPEVEDVLCMEHLLYPYVAETGEKSQVLCYSEEVTKLLNPEMSEGRWFTDTDTEADTLCAVVAYNGGRYEAGDTVTLWEPDLSDAQVSVKIIGVLADGASLYYSDGLVISDEDYRDCYTTFSDPSGEADPTFILSDAQILAGQDAGNFGALNYRIGEESLPQEMTGIVILTFADDVSEETIDGYVDQIRQHSGSAYFYRLSVIRQNSLDSIFKSLKLYIPIFICVIFFLLLTTISANVVMAKRQMRNYVIYYTCGLTWKQCASVSLGISMLLSAVSVMLVAGLTAWLSLTGKETHLFGLWQILTVAGILIFYNVMAWIVPYSVVRKESAIHIITENNI